MRYRGTICVDNLGAVLLANPVLFKLERTNAACSWRLSQLLSYELLHVYHYWYPTDELRRFISHSVARSDFEIHGSTKM